MGTRMVTAGIDGTVKVWDTRKWAVLNEFMFKKTPKAVSFSQKGLLGLGWGNHVSVSCTRYCDSDSGMILTGIFWHTRFSRICSDRDRTRGCRRRRT